MTRTIAIIALTWCVAFAVAAYRVSTAADRYYARIVGVADDGRAIVELEPVTPAPDPKPEPKPDPDPQPGTHGHYDAVAKDAVASYSLRDPLFYVRPYSNGSHPVGVITYDPALDAAKITLPPGRGSIPTSDYLRLPFPPISITDTGEVSIQWEARWSSSYLGVTGHGLDNHKSFRIDRLGSGEERVIELQTRFMNATEDTVALPTIRSYFGAVGGDGKRDPLSVGKDYQPGASIDPYRLPPNAWVRFTLSLTYANGEQRVRLWVADEQTDPFLLIADPDDSAKGFLCGTDASLTNVCQFLVLHNTSQEGLTNTEPLVSWVRNVAVFRDKTVPLGGRPGKEG